jgi:hypothetical protein
VLQDVFRAIDEQGQVIVAIVSARRDTQDATAFLQRAVVETGGRPHTVANNKVVIYLDGGMQPVYRPRLTDEAHHQPARGPLDRPARGGGP